MSLEKYDELSESLAFGQKLRHFTDQNGAMVGQHGIEFWVFSFQKWMLQTVLAEKLMTKMESFAYFPCSFKVHFLRFCSDLSKKSKSVKANYIYVSESLVTHFQKIVLFIMQWLTVSEILDIEFDEIC